MKTTLLTIALGLATLPLTFAQTPAPSAPSANKPAATATAKNNKTVAATPAKTAKKAHKKAVKKTARKAVKTNTLASTAPAPVKK